MFGALRKKTVLYTWVVIFSVVLLIPALTNFYILNRVKRTLRSETESKNQYVLNLIQKNCDSMLEDADRAAKQLAKNELAIRIADEPLSAAVRYDAARLSTAMEQTVGGVYLKDTFLYFPQSDLIVTKEGVWESRRFFDSHQDFGENYDAWMQKIRSYRAPYGDCGETRINFYTDTGSFVVCISVDKQIVLRETFMAESDDIIAVVNSRGEMIYRWGPAIEDQAKVRAFIGAGTDKQELSIDGVKMMGISKKSSVFRYRYIYLSPLSVQNKTMERTLWMGIVSSLFCLTVMLALLVLFMTWNYGQIRHLMQNILPFAGENAKGRNEFDFINANIQSYKKQIRTYERRAILDNEMRHFAAVADALRGFGPEKEIPELTQSKGRSGCVFFAEIEDCGVIADDSRNKNCIKDTQFVVRNVWNDLNGSAKTEWTVMPEGLTGIFTADGLPQNCRETLGALFEITKDVLMKNLEISVSFYVSGIAAGCGDLPQLYRQAVKSLEFGRFYGLADIFYDDIEKAEGCFPDIPQTCENALINTIRSGDKEAAQREMDKILNDYLLSRPVGSWYVSSFAVILIYIIKNASGRDFRADEIKMATDAKELTEYLKRFLDEVMQDQNGAEQTDLSEKIMQYIEKNYTNPDLCVNSIGEEFAMSAQYASRLFKEKKGFRIVDLIHKLRISYAKKLLRQDENIKVEELAQRVGYGTTRAFMMRFKEREGITPTQYRRSIAEICWENGEEA